MANRYGELLKDPRWQKKRLEIMQRDKFTCQLCGDKDSTLNVHHMWYGKDPWDVPNYLLITLCEPCHKKEEAAIGNIPKVFKTFNEYGILSLDMMEVCLAAFEYTDRVGGSNREKILKVIEAVKTMK